MKNSLFLLGAAAVVALSSCTKNEVLDVTESRAISFNGTGIDNITRADITSGGFNQFFVYGGYGENAVFNKISVAGGTGAWSYSPTQYWANGTWNFAGYAIGKGTTSYDGLVPAWDNASGKLTLEVNSDANHQDDVVFAATKNIKVTDATSYSNPVTLNFTHILSKIQFKFTKEEKSLGGVTVKLSGFTVSGLTTNAKWVDGTQGAADEAATGSYTAFTEATEVTADNGLSTTEFYVIPQTIGTFSITAKATITDVNGTNIKEGTVTATVPSTTIKEWVAQNKYVYTAELTYDNIVSPEPGKDPKPIVFEGSASDWTNGGTTDPIIP